MPRGRRNRPWAQLTWQPTQTATGKGQQQYSAGTLPITSPQVTTMSQNMTDEMETSPSLTLLLQDFYGKVKVQPRIYEQDQITEYIGHNYGVHGYQGDVTSPWTAPGCYLPEGYWDFTPYNN